MSGAIATPEPTSPFRRDCLAGRVVLITGGATGIGYAIAEAFGAHGCKVAIMSRKLDVINNAVTKLRGMGIDAFGTTVDVKDAARCVTAADEVAAHFGRIDFLVNNAAGNFMVSLEELSPGGLATVLGMDLQGVFHMSKACLPHLKTTGLQTGGSVIINISAFLQDMATPFQSHAASAKAGIDAMTQQIGVEWAEYGIRCVGLAPGGIAGTVGGPGGRVFGNDENKASTDNVNTSGNENVGVAEDARKTRRDGIPAGRWGRVDDVALAAVFMCSNAAPWITATRLTIDGGSWHRVKGFVEAKDVILQKSLEQRAKFKGQGGRSKM